MDTTTAYMSMYVCPMFALYFPAQRPVSWCPATFASLFLAQAAVRTQAQSNRNISQCLSLLPHAQSRWQHPCITLFPRNVRNAFPGASKRHSNQESLIPWCFQQAKPEGHTFIIPCVCWDTELSCYFQTAQQPGRPTCCGVLFWKRNKQSGLLHQVLQYCMTIQLPVISVLQCIDIHLPGFL